MAEQPAPAGEPAAPPPPDDAPWTFDLTRISRKEYNGFRRGLLSDEADTALLARVTGMSADEIDNLDMLRYRRLVRDLYRRVRQPLENDPKG